MLSERTIRSLRRTGQLPAVNGWSDDDERALRDAVKGRIVRYERRRRVLRVAGPVVVVVGVGAALLLTRRPHEAPVVAVAPPAGPIVAPLPVAETPGRLVLGDGSVVTVEDPRNGVQRVTAPGAEIARLAFTRGKLHFEPVVRDARPYEIAVGQAVVRVLGAAFTLNRGEGDDAVEIAVERGSARIIYPGGERVVEAGERAVFPAEAGAPPAPQLNEAGRGKGAAGWRSLAHAGRYEAAFKALARAPDPVRDEPQDLMLAADVARLSRHPEQAITPLRRVVARYAGDDRAPPAAFLLGRVLRESLGRAGEAADAFARARALSPRGALAEDALVREIEARVQAGQRSRVVALGEEYARLYPRGARRAEVQSLVGPR